MAEVGLKTKEFVPAVFSTPTIGASASPGINFDYNKGRGGGGILSNLSGLAGLSALGPIGMGVGAASSIIDTIANIYYQADYKKAMEKNRKLAEKIYNEQRADEQAAIAREQEREQYQRGIYTKEFAYKVGQEKKAEDWTKKQDRYSKYVQFVSNFNDYLNRTPQIRQQYIQNWAAM